MLGEFFAAAAGDIEQFVEDGPFERVETVEAKGLSEVSLATLGEILGVGSYDELVDRIGDGRQAESGEAGALPIPAAFRDSLAGMDSVRAVAERWAATDELRRDEWTADDAAEVLRNLCRLAQRAASDELDLWYWWSL
jgi:hypothetical protein